jgi:DNA-binding transcriptional MerR regulator
MRTYSIKDLEQLSGIKAHTLRIWERRYQLLTPERTGSNIRYYNDDDVRRLLNAVVLLEHGTKISKISKLNEDEVSKTVIEIFNDSKIIAAVFEATIGSLIKAGLAYDEPQFDRVIESSFRKIGIQDTFIKIIYPFLKRVGLLWGVNQMCVGQEHFLSNIIMKKLFSAIDALRVRPKGPDRYLLFLHDEEDHEIGLLFAHYLARVAGKKGIYLGAHVPFNDVKQVIADFAPTHLFTLFITTRPHSFFQKYLKQLASVASQCSILISGNSSLVKNVKLATNIKCLNSIEEFNELLSNKKNNLVK